MLPVKPKQIALGLLALALLKSLTLLLVIPPAFGPDGAGYLRYVDALANPTHPDTVWHIRGTTPIYPLFAYVVYLPGFGTAYSLILAQILLGAVGAPALYLALRPLERRGALLAGVFIAADPQTGYLFQLVSTEALYISLLTLGLAAFIWLAGKNGVSMPKSFLLGVLIGVGALTRPVGLLLIVPYAAFYLVLTRSWRRSTALVCGYVLVYIVLSTLHWWRFDFFAPNNTSGLYLGTRLFGVGGLYARDNGAGSEQLYQLAAACDLTLTDTADAKTLQITQDLRLCLAMTHQMELDAISTLYQRAYAEATRAKPGSFVATMLKQLGAYAWRTSDPYDYNGAKELITECGSAPSAAWNDAGRLFCPPLPSLLRFLGQATFWGMLAFSLLTRPINFAGLFLPGGGRWVLLLCLAGYSYHAVVTAFAGTILSRYLTVTNPYTLTALALTLSAIYGQRERLDLKFLKRSRKQT